MSKGPFDISQYLFTMGYKILVSKTHARTGHFLTLKIFTVVDGDGDGGGGWMGGIFFFFILISQVF